MAFKIKITKRDELIARGYTGDTLEYLSELVDLTGHLSLGDDNDKNKVKIPPDFQLDGVKDKKWLPDSKVGQLCAVLDVKYPASKTKSKHVLAGNGSNESDLSTKEQEIITAIHCMLKVNGLQVNKQNFISEYNSIKFGARDIPGAENLYAKSLKDKSWVKSFDVASNKFASKFKGHKLTVLYGSSSGILAKVYKHAKELLKKEGHTFDVNKWNPADVWFCTDEYPVHQKDLLKTTDIHSFNKALLELLKKNILVPVSLKKVGDYGNIGLVNTNRDESGKNVFHVKPRDIKYVKATNIGLSVENFANSKDIYIRFNCESLGDVSIQCRTFQSDGTNFSAEIKAGHNSKANHGKIGIVLIQSTLNDAAGNKSHSTFFKEYSMIHKKMLNPSDSTLEEFYKKWVYLKNHRGNDLLIESSPFVRRMYDTLVEGSSPDEYSKFANMVHNKSLDWRVSKYLGVNIAYHMLTLKDEMKMKKFVLELYKLASSQHEASAPYYKIM